jgi:phenylalanyl-tRNA synthetase beta chain
MRAPLEWLYQYCAPELPAAKVAERLAMTGTEVERVERFGVTALDRFVVGRVLEAQAHPGADRLSVCSVDVGDGSPSQIVCGAPNVRQGQLVAVAKPGAVMAGGATLQKAKLRGVESEGMILAEDELAIGPDHDEIIVLEDDARRPGQPLREVLPISTDVLVLEITPNRPDCLGIYGVARELHAATAAPLHPPPWATDPGGPGEVAAAAVEVLCPELCPRFTARVFEDVKLGPSPPWLKARLMAAGQRPISNVVDITNYVMLETGQPLHAYDLDRVAGRKLTIRRASEREQLQTLDGQLRSLDPDMVVIEDERGPTGIAGLMGGARSEVGADTTRVLMEVANWNGANIHRTSLKLGLRTEASTRFEKQLQPEQALEAQAVATQLMIELCGARLNPGTIDVGGPGPEPPTIRLRDDRLSGLLGVTIERGRSREILEALEFAVKDAPDGLDVKPPTFRRDDVSREADVIEEVARLEALDKLPATLPATHRAAEAALARGAGLAGAQLTGRQKLRRAAADALAAQGLYEIVGWSFVGPGLAERLRLPDQPAVELENPLSIEQSRLRTTLLGSLLDTAAFNHSRGITAIRLFEAGAVYLPREGRRLPEEPYRIGALMTGPVRQETWRQPEPREIDFFAAKGVLQGLLDKLRVPWDATPGEQPFLHPGRGARITAGNVEVGWIGEIHPLVTAEWDFEQTVAAFELDLDALGEPTTPIYEDVTSFPAVREDLAVVVPERVASRQVVEVALEAGAPLLGHAEVFDVYRDPERIGPGKVSLAIRLTYRAPDRTLTDEEVAERRQAIVEAVEERLKGSIRG